MTPIKLVANTDTLEDELNIIGHRIREMDPDSHTALLAAIIGSLKGPAGYDPESIRAAVKTIETAVDDFEKNLRFQI